MNRTHNRSTSTPDVTSGQPPKYVNADPYIEGARKRGLVKPPKYMNEEVVKNPLLTGRTVTEGSSIKNTSIKVPLQFYNQAEVASDMVNDKDGADYELALQWLEELIKGEDEGEVNQAMMWEESSGNLKCRRDYFFPKGLEEAEKCYHNVCSNLSSTDTEEGEQNLTAGQKLLENTYSNLGICAQCSLEKLYPELDYRKGKTKDTLPIYTLTSKADLQQQGIRKSDTHVYNRRLSELDSQGSLQHTEDYKRLLLTQGYLDLEDALKAKENNSDMEILLNSVDLDDFHALYTDKNNALRAAFATIFTEFKYPATNLATTPPSKELLEEGWYKEAPEPEDIETPEEAAQRRAEWKARRQFFGELENELGGKVEKYKNAEALTIEEEEFLKLCEKLLGPGGWSYSKVITSVAHCYRVGRGVTPNKEISDKLYGLVNDAVSEPEGDKTSSSGSRSSRSSSSEDSEEIDIIDDIKSKRRSFLGIFNNKKPELVELP